MTRKRVPANNWIELRTCSPDHNKDDLKTRTALLNFYWIIAILISLLILFIAFIFFDDRILEGQKVIEFISTGALILSIILSVMAIQHTYTSNSQIDRRFDDINKAAGFISEVARDISGTNSKLDGHLDQILSRLDDIDKSMAGYKQNNPDVAEDFKGNKINSDR